MLEPSAKMNQMSQKEEIQYNMFNGTKTGHCTMSNSCISTDKSPSYSEKTVGCLCKREVNELLNYMINSLESTNSNMKQKLKISTELSVYDHLKQIKQDFANGKIKKEKVNEDDKEDHDEHNPYVYPNNYNLLSTSKRYGILAEIRDRTDERILQYEKVLEKLYQNIIICDDKSLLMNVINEQKTQMQNAFNKKNKDKGLGSSERDGKMSGSNKYMGKQFIQRDLNSHNNLSSYYNNNEDNNSNNSFNKAHYSDILQKIIIGKDKKTKFNQGSYSIGSNSNMNKYNIDIPFVSTQQTSTQALYRNPSVGSFNDKDTKSIQFYENKAKRSSNDNQGISMINTNSKFDDQSPIKKQK